MDIPWREESRTLAFRHSIRFHKSVFREWTSEQPLSHLEPSSIASAPNRIIVWIMKQVFLYPYIGLWVNATTSASGLFLLQQALLYQQYSHVHVELGIKKQVEASHAWNFYQHFWLDKAAAIELHGIGECCCGTHGNCWLRLQTN